MQNRHSRTFLQDLPRSRMREMRREQTVLNKKMEDEGFRNEAREHAQKEMMAELKNEANARHVVQNDLQAIKDKIRQLESGSYSGCTVGSDVSRAVGEVVRSQDRRKD